MQYTELSAEIRSRTGTGPARQLRRRGLLPAVLYGKGLATRTIAVPEKSVDDILRTKLGKNTLIRIAIPDGTQERVMIKDYQGDVLTRRLTHVDFYAVKEDQTLTVSVPLRVEGKAAGLQQGGILEVITREVDLICKVGHIPDEIKVDVSPLNIGQNLHLSDIKLPPGTSVREKYNPTLVAVHEPAKEEVVAPAPTAAVAETAAAASVPATAQKAEGDKAAAAAPADAKAGAKPGAKPAAGKASEPAKAAPAKK